MRLTLFMGVVETDKLPVGKRARAAFVAALEASDDRAERHYLEMKSEFDLNQRADRRKVVKFILGAAHREPARAGRHFEGHAIMVLGLPRDGVRGVSKFEVMDLEREINEFAGPDPPGWDIDTIPVDDDRDIVLIIVDPPSGRIWPVLKNGEPLWSGDIYLRADGETRKANGPEMVAMLGRAVEPGRLLDVSVEPVGEIVAYVVDDAELRAFIAWHVGRLEEQVGADSSPLPFGRVQPALLMDRRSRQGFLNEVDEWAAGAMEQPTTGLHDLAAQHSRPFAVKVINNTTTSLKDVRLDLGFSAHLTALDWEKPDEQVDLFAERPLDWGKDSLLSSVSTRDLRAVQSSANYDGAIRIEKRSPAELVVELRRLHAEQTVTTPDDDVVLVSFPTDPAAAPKAITVNWTLVAGGINEVLKGSFEVNAAPKDWRGPLRSFMASKRRPAGDEA